MHSLGNKVSISNFPQPIAGFLIWLILTISIYTILLFYKQQPGKVLPSPTEWPISTGLKQAKGRFTLAMFVHPHCPCSAATINELAVLMTRCPDLKAYILFLKPTNVPNNWEKSNLWYRAQSIPGVTVLSDELGQEAEIFKSLTSGQALVYNPNGKLVFSGGITSGRGHEGDNQGLDIIVQLVSQEHNYSGAHPGKLTDQNTPVFGCPLQTDNSDSREVLAKCRK